VTKRAVNWPAYARLLRKTLAMGKWAQSRHRGGGGIRTDNSLPVPFLEITEPAFLGWSVTGPAPLHALLQVSADEAGPFTDVDQVLWTDVPNGPRDTDLWYRVFGQDAGDNLITQASNVVQLE